MTRTFVAPTSIQRLKWTGSAEGLASTYFAWVNARVVGVRAQVDGTDVRLVALGRCLIGLRQTDEGVFEVAGGDLTANPPSGHLVFEKTSDEFAQISLRGFAPRLPRAVYLRTQFALHEVVMERFVRDVLRGKFGQETSDFS